MNGDDNYNNTIGSANRNAYYNLDVPEWRCENCGKFNHKESRFCRSCGVPGSLVANSEYVAEMPQKKGSAAKWIAVVAAIVIVVAALTVVVIKFILRKDKQNETAATNNQTEASANTVDNNTYDNNTDTGVNQDQYTDSGQGSAENSYYVVDGTYYIQPDEGVNVREGPGTNYNIVLNQDGKKIALRRGTSVVCQGMSDDGNWMKITLGWICVWDGNETLVR